MMRKILKALFSVALAAATFGLPALGAAGADSPVTLQVEGGYGGVVPQGGWAPIQVNVTNHGPEAATPDPACLLSPVEAFGIDIPLSARGEYEITDYVSTLAARRPFRVVAARFWMPIGTEAAWQQAQTQPLEQVMTPSSSPPAR